MSCTSRFGHAISRATFSGIFVPVLLACAALLFTFEARGADKEYTANSQGYVGAEACRDCHQDIYKTYRKTGHPYKIQRVDGGPPVYPDGTSPGVFDPPADKTWNDITHVIGGFAWKARFMDKEGYILTGDKNRQYNLPNEDLGLDAGWTGYSAKKAPRKPYTCGTCHTTGWITTGEDGPHQDGFPGIYGTWSEPGVTCEGCHGPGLAHANDPEKNAQPFEENCGDCHRRGRVTQIDSKGGLIRHHEQYEDLLASPHRYLKCSSCHEPHKSVKYDSGGFKGTKETCLACHEKQVVQISAKDKFECITCHMPRAGKSAVAVKHKFVGGEVPEGDVRAHLFRIKRHPSWKLFTDDGKFVRVNDDGKAFLNVEYACMACHTDKDKKWAIEESAKVHPK